jgi:polyisoprenoid-binding protein YceI
MSTQTYQLDSTHSAARFSVRHMMISRVHGEFTGLSGTLEFDPAAHEAAKVVVDLDVASVSTHQADRDTHLKSADFFDVAQYPQITFVSTGVSKLGDEEATITGDLTIHGVSKPVTLHVEGSPVEIKDPWGNLRLGFTGKTKIKRSDFGLTYNAALETGGVLIGDDIEITLDVQFVRPGA